MERREFLKTGTAALGVTSLSPLLGCSSGPDVEWHNRQSTMAYRRLGRTNLMVSRVVLGGDGIGPGQTDNVRLAIDMGLNYGDTAPQYMHPDSEAGYGEVFQSSALRDRLIINTKVSLFDNNRRRLFTQIYESLGDDEKQQMDHRARDILEEREILAEDYLGRYGTWQDPSARQSALVTAVAEKYGNTIDRRKEYYQFIIDSIERSLKKLKIDYVDQMMCPHGADTPEEVNIPEIFEAYEKLRQDGKVRFLGFSSHTDPAGVLRGAIKNGRYHTAQVAYNVLNQRRVAPAIKEAREADMGIIAMKGAKLFAPLEGTDRPAPHMIALLDAKEPGEMSLIHRAYLHNLKDSNLTAVISSMDKVEYVRQNLPLALMAENAAKS